MTRSISRHLPFFLVLALSGTLLWRAGALADGIRAGLSLSVTAVIPAIFPFAVLSPYLQTLPLATRKKKGLFSRVFRLPTAAVLPLFVGLVCGFPLGAKVTRDGYSAGLYTKEEAERILCFANNPSIAFVVLGVGKNLRGRMLDGVILFAVEVLVSLIIALILSLLTKTPREEDSARPLPHVTPPHLTQAMRDAVSASLTVTGFIAFFSGLLAVLKTFLPTAAYLAAAALMEVGTACAALAPLAGGLVPCGFAICFSGLSVAMQTAAMLDGTDLSLRRAFFWTTVAGILGSAMTYGALLIFS